MNRIVTDHTLETTRVKREAPCVKELIKKLHVNQSEIYNTSRQSGSRLGLVPLKNTKGSLKISASSNKLNKSNSIKYVTLVKEDSGFESQRRDFFARIVNSEYSVDEARKFARCFISAVKSFEEVVTDTEAKGAFIRIISLLYKAWRNLMKLIKSKEDNYTNEIMKLEANIKELNKQAKWQKVLSEKQINESPCDSIKGIFKIRLDPTKGNKKKTLSAAKLKKTFGVQATQCDLSNNSLHKTEVSNEINKHKQKYVRQCLEKKIEDTLRVVYNAVEVNKQDIEVKLAAINLQFKHLLEERSNLKAQLLQLNADTLKLKKELREVKREWHSESIKNSELTEIITAKETAIDHLSNTIIKLETDLQIMSQHYSSNYKEQNIEHILKDIINSNNALTDWEEDIYSKTITDTNINLSNWTIKKPSYQSLVSELYLTKSVPVVYSPGFSLWLHVLVRYIFDSYYSEMLCGRMAKFPEFVIGWLSMYGVDSSSRKIYAITAATKDVLVPSAQLNLVHQLNSSLIGKRWDTKVFSEFVNETSSLDELHFYLHARVRLFGGSQMAHEEALTSLVHLVPIKDAFNLVDELMVDTTKEYRSNVKNKLVEYNDKMSKDNIDSAMVLGILLEYYKDQKKQKILQFKNIFNKVLAKQVIPNPKANLREFQILLREGLNVELSTEELARLYRRIYIVGRSGTRLDSILTTFSEL